MIRQENTIRIADMVQPIRQADIRDCLNRVFLGRISQ